MVAPVPSKWTVSSQRDFSLPAPLARLRFQIPIVVVVCALLPAIAVGDSRFWDPRSFSATSNAFYAALLSAIFGLLLFRKIGAFPGITSFGQVAPAVAGPYISALTFILVSRLDYSRPVLLMSAGFTAVLFYGLWLYRRRRCAPAVYVIPGTNFSAGLIKAHEADWKRPLESLDRNPIIVADLRQDLEDHWHDYLLQAALSGIPVFHFKQLQESLLGRVEVEHLSENSFGSINPGLLYLKVKRISDLVLSLASLPLLIVLFALIGIAIKVDSPGPIFYYQNRRGYRGKTFGMIKFRSMVQDKSMLAGLEHARTQTADPRITRTGRFIRRYRLDELPQVINVIRGEMSWIGPRPEASELSSWYQTDIPFYGYRHVVRPGVTGWAQVHQGHVHSLDEVTEKLEYDFYYIKYFSWWLDALIILRTVRTLLVGNGAR